MAPRANRLMARAVVAVIPALLLALSSCYAPDFANDQLQCGDNSACPKGYSCAADNRCWKNGAQPAADAGGQMRFDNFVGTWVFTGGTLNATCTDGPPYQRALTGDSITILTGNVGLLEQYYCQTGWNLRLPLGTTTAVAPTGQTCVERTTDSGSGIMTTYTWSASELSFTTSDGQTATTTGHIMGPFSASDNTHGTCDVTYTGPLHKP